MLPISSMGAEFFALGFTPTLVLIPFFVLPLDSLSLFS